MIRGTLLLLALCTAANAATVTLPTGDRVTVNATQDGKPLVRIDPAAKGAAFQTLVVGDHVYVVPQTANPADAAIFDVTGGGTLVTPGAPAGKLYTLTVKGFDRHGRRVYGSSAIAFNVDDSNQYVGAQAFFQGSASFSVPAGHYQVSSLIFDSGTFSFVSNEVEVRSNNVIVVLDAKKANPIGVTMPAPVDTLIASMTLQRTPATGPSFSNGFMGFGPEAMYAAPEAPVSVGTQYLYVTYRMGDPASAIYDLRFDYPGGIPQRLDRTVARADLAAYQTTWHSSTPSHTVFEGRLSLAPWQADASYPSLAFTAPVTRMEYVLPAADARWLQVATLDPQGFDATLQGNWLTPRAGDSSAVSWNAQPQAPDIREAPGEQQQCPACRAGDTLNVEIFPFVDNAGHVMTPDGDLGVSASLYMDGQLRETQPGTRGSFALDPSPATYQLVLDVERDAGWWPTSARTHTVWTWASSERAGDPLPSGWTCGGGKGGGGGGGRGAPTKGGGGGGSDCSFEPLLFATYDTHAGADDVVAGNAAVDVTLRKQIFFGSVNVTAFTFDVSFDDGASWTAASATPVGGGRFHVTYAQPASAQFASIKISATDDQGDGLDQTIFHAYPLAPLPPASSTPPGPRSAASACTAIVPTPFAQCMARVTPESAAGRPKPFTGLTPTDLASAYNLPAGAGAGRTVAIVDAYDDPNAEADMNAFRAQYGLPPCTTANGCFRKVNQQGLDGPLPWADTGWGVEISLDLDAVSATCPDCRIILVEADSPSLFDLAPSVDTAVRLGADVVSNSYGSIGEFSGETWFDQFYQHDGTPIVVSSGDYGYGNGLPLVGGVSYPAVSEFVTAVGGTTLVRDGSPRGWSESAWAGSTSGCSAYIHKPGWQKDNLCKKRTVADIAAVGDPQTGLAVYDSYGFENPWIVVGGTSLSAPIIASIYAMAGNTASVKNASDLYKSGAPFFDAVGGSNGNCSGTYLCTGLPGYDAPTGLGTPNGTQGF